MASKNLDISEKMELGGMYGVRAYPEGEAYADEGVLLTLEARQQVPLPAGATGQLHLAAFIDAGTVKPNHKPWLGARLFGQGVLCPQARQRRGPLRPGQRWPRVGPGCQVFLIRGQRDAARTPFAHCVPN